MKTNLIREFVANNIRALAANIIREFVAKDWGGNIFREKGEKVRYFI